MRLVESTESPWFINLMINSKHRIFLKRNMHLLWQSCLSNTGIHKILHLRNSIHKRILQLPQNLLLNFSSNLYTILRFQQTNHTIHNFRVIHIPNHSNNYKIRISNRKSNSVLLPTNLWIRLLHTLSILLLQILNTIQLRLY